MTNDHRWNKHVTCCHNWAHNPEDTFVCNCVDRNVTNDTKVDTVKQKWICKSGFKSQYCVDRTDFCQFKAAKRIMQQK